MLFSIVGKYCFPLPVCNPGSFDQRWANMCKIQMHVVRAANIFKSKFGSSGFDNWNSKMNIRNAIEQPIAIGFPNPIPRNITDLKRGTFGLRERGTVKLPIEMHWEEWIFLEGQRRKRHEIWPIMISTSGLSLLNRDSWEAIIRIQTFWHSPSIHTAPSRF